MSAAVRRPRSPVIKVEVTREIIERAKPADSKACMIAEAIKAKYPDVKAVSVDLQTVRFTDTKRGLRYAYLTPRRGQEALLQFDMGVDPGPFDMTLRSAHVTRLKGRTIENDPLSKPSIRKSDSGKPMRTGGRAPPQIKRTRIFGIRAFPGFNGDTPPPAKAQPTGV